MNNTDKDDFSNAIKFFQNIINTISTPPSSYKMGATFIGIKTNISGNFKLHFYILLFPFIKDQPIVPYSHSFSNIYFKDLCFDVDESFYLWIYEEMKKQNSIVIMSLESNILKVVNNTDLLINIDKNCDEKKEWMDLNYEDWYEKHIFNNVFTITIVNPHLYMVPFPVKPIIIKTIQNMNHVRILHP